MTGVDWRQQAACRGADPHLFDALSEEERRVCGSYPDSLERIQQARSFCAGCPVLSSWACLRRGCGSCWVAGKRAAA
jgi:hypothetical protein